MRNTSSPVADPPLGSTGSMSLLDHLGELRRRIFYAAIVVIGCAALSFSFRVEIFQWICGPLSMLPDQELQVLGLTEMFVTYLKLSVVAAIFVSAPWILFQVWRFIAPGLYGHEKRWIIPFVVLGSLFFIAGGAFAFYAVMPLGFEYLVKMVPEGVAKSFQVADYVGLVIRLMLAFGIVFELPLLMWILAAAGLVGPKTFASVRKYWIVSATVIGAFLTPPDPITQMMMAAPLILFFEIGIIGARILYHRDNDDTQDQQEEEISTTAKKSQK